MSNAIVGAPVGAAASMALALALAALSAVKPRAQTFPDRIIKLIVPQAPGSATDTLARIVGAELGPQLGQTIVIENRPGGALTIGLDIVAKSPPDGYTLGMGPVGALAITRHLVKKLPYDIERDFQPIAQVTRGHLLLAVTPKLPIKSVAELIARGEVEARRPRQCLVEQRLARPCRRRAVQVHDRHEHRARALSRRRDRDHGPDLRPGAIDVRKPVVDRAVRESRARSARWPSAAPKRSPAFPDLPTIAEAGVPGYDAPTWSGVIGPAGIPRPIVDGSMRRSTAPSRRRASSSASRSSATSRPAARRRTSPP